MTSRVIALDLDGTLLTPQKTLLPSSLEALKRAGSGISTPYRNGSTSRSHSPFLSGTGVGYTCNLL